MASIRKTGKQRWQVRWTEADGTERGQTESSLTLAKKVKREVEEAIALGKRWEPKAAREGVDLRDVHRDYLREVTPVLSPSTARRYATILDMWERWLLEVYGDTLPVSLLSRRTLAAHYEWLGRPAPSGRVRAEATRWKHMNVIQGIWAWSFDDELYGADTPRPRKLRLAAPAGQPVRAPTWAEMDRAISALEPASAHRRLAILLRFTGLRVSQAEGLRWSDVDPKRGWLSVRGELGKSRQERMGRRIPLSPNLLIVLSGWEQEGPFIVPRGRGGPGTRQARGRDMCAAWETAEVDPEIWKQRPHHSFRKGFTTGLKRLGADDEAVRFLVGHSRGIRANYVDPLGLPLEAAVALIPPLHRDGEGDRAEAEAPQKKPM